MREIENFEAGMGIGLTFAAVGMSNAASNVGAAIAEGIADARWAKQIDAHARQAARAMLAAQKEKAATSAAANAFLVSFRLAAARKGLKVAA
jgi:hypothetical protein